MSDFAIDCSIAIAWVHPSQSSALSNRLFEEASAGAQIVVPSLWFLETANALLVLERRRKLTRAERTESLRLLEQMRLQVDEDGPRRAFGELSRLGDEEGLSIYDACYLELALRRGIPLASHDTSLINAATQRGVTVMK